MSENFIPLYDLESLSEAQRQDYIKAVCKHMGVPDNLNLVALTYVDETEGPSRLVPYAKRGATENVRNNLQIDVTSLTNQMVGGSVVFTATATSKKNGRQEISTGSKYIKDLAGTALDDAIMTAQTRALRRVTLQFVGAGVLDESEVNQRKIVHVSPAIAQPAQSTVAPNSEPGKDITLIGPSSDSKTQDQVALVIALRDSELPIKKTQEQFEAEQAQLRKDAIAQLNEKEKPSEELVKKTRKPRGPNKKKIDLGPSELPAAQVAVKPEPVAACIPSTETAQAVVAASAPEQVVVTAPLPASTKPRLNPDQVRPFRQRLFKLVNDQLEPNGFEPKEGIGNADKMRSFAQIMFPDIANMNELTLEQWEKYLTVLETKLKEAGPVNTWKYIETEIGL